MILIIYAHPYPQHSHANKRMLEQAGTLEGVEIRSLYQLYPDFNIDVAAEQAALARADLVIWQHPMQWYSVPPLLKLWMDKVLSHGWAYGHNGIALRGKSLMWAVTTGGGESHFDIGSFPGFPVLAQPLQATALYCGMKWLPPFAMHCTFICDDETLQAQARRYRQRLIDWQEHTRMDSHTLIQALIYLGAAALIVPIAVRLGLGSVLGYLIAGCIIGPWALRLVTDAEAILHFAEIGVVLMLFVIGLELDPQRLWKLRASVFGGGALQMVACGVLIGLFCMLLGLRWRVAELIESFWRFLPQALLCRR